MRLLLQSTLMRNMVSAALANTFAAHSSRLCSAFFWVSLHTGSAGLLARKCLSPASWLAVPNHHHRVPTLSRRDLAYVRLQSILTTL